MRIIWTNRHLKVDYGYFKPFNRYIVTDFEWQDILLKKDDITDLHHSSFNSYERRYGGQDLNGKKVVIYRHNAYGDQLLVSALPRYLKHLYPDSVVHLYCHPAVMPLWLGNPFMGGSAISLPMHFDVHDMYDYHIFLEGMLENNSERDQGCCIDDMFAFCGFRDVDPVWKVPCVQERPEDYKFANEVQYSLSKPYVVYHAAPANKNRTYPLAQGRLLCDMLRDGLDMDVLIVGHDKEEKYVRLFDETPEQTKKKKGPHIFNFINMTENFRSLIPIVKHAKAVVCPDSSVMHLAACFPVPVVSLWGVFHPNDRVKYYQNHTALTGFKACPHAPCRDHNFFLPEDHCKDAKSWDKKYCAALGSIGIEEIVETVKEKMIGGGLTEPPERSAS